MKGNERVNFTALLKKGRGREITERNDKTSKWVFIIDFICFSLF